MYEPTAYDWESFRRYQPAVNEYVPNPDEIREWKIRLNAEKGLDGPPPEPVPLTYEVIEHLIECEVDDE